MGIGHVCESYLFDRIIRFSRTEGTISANDREADVRKNNQMSTVSHFDQFDLVANEASGMDEIRPDAPLKT